MSQTHVAVLFAKNRGLLERPAALMERQFLMHKQTEDEIVYVFNGRRIAAYAALGLISLYLAGAGALTVLSGRQPFNQLAFADYALPWRWDGIADKQATANLQAGFHELAQRNWGEGINRLKIGLRGHPERAEARLTLARIYVRMQRPVEAVDLVLDGLAYGDPSLDYLREFTDTVEAAQEFRKVVGVYRVYATGPKAKFTDERRDFLFESALTASVRMRDLPLLRELWGGVPEAQRTARAAERYVFGLLTLASVAEGQAELARLRLQFPHDQGLSNLSAVAARLMGGSSRAFLEAVDALRRKLATPEQTVFVVMELAQGGYPEQASEIVNDLPPGSADTSAILSQVAARAKFLANPAPLFRAVLAKAEAIRMDAVPLLMPLCEAHLRYLNLTEAQQVLVAIQRLDSAVTDATQAWVRCMQAVVFACSQDNPASALEVVTSARLAGLNADGYAWVIDAILRAGSLVPANSLSEYAASVYPRSQELQRLLFIARQARSIKDADRTYFGSKPVPANSDSEFVFLATLDLLAREGKYHEVLTQISRLRALNPEWLPRRLDALDLAELRSLAWVGDLGHFKALLNVYLRDNAERAKSLFPLLHEFERAKPKPPGLTVLAEVLEKYSADGM